ncbi:MAG: M24 family metallopeptidase [Tepidisphaeraceae bacterium]|jgi:Xaa-Pro aminopeptidase
MDDEIRIKLDRLGKFLDRHGLDGVFLNHRANFAWITAGKDNHVASNSPNGVAGIIATPDKRICFTTSIEGPRYATEELAETGIEVFTYPWQDAKAGRTKLKDLIAGRKIAADVTDSGEFDRFGAGLVHLPDDFVQLRWSLTEPEIQRYREGGRRTSAAIEAACRLISPNMTEHEIAAVLDAEVRKRSLLPVVTLVAADDRVAKFRHPIPTDLRLSRYCMLVTCASFGGLISNVTRLVSFQPLSAEIKKKQQAVCNVDAAVNLSTKPGKTLGEMFKVVDKAYADNGFAGEYALHHQGGSTGYAGREAFADPASEVRVLENQAFAWNPSITGVKSEDTILCRGGGIELITTVSADWPMVRGKFADQSLDRPDILVR